MMSSKMLNLSCLRWHLVVLLYPITLIINVIKISFVFIVCNGLSRRKLCSFQCNFGENLLQRNKVFHGVPCGNRRSVWFKFDNWRFLERSFHFLSFCCILGIYQSWRHEEDQPQDIFTGRGKLSASSCQFYNTNAITAKTITQEQSQKVVVHDVMLCRPSDPSSDWTIINVIVFDWL